MKFFALTIFAVLGCAFAAPSASDELTSSEERIVERFISNYMTELDRYAGNMMKEVAEAICADKNTDLETPLKEVIKRMEEVDTESETVCSMVQNHLVHVLDPMIKAIDGCLPNKEAGVADFGVKAIVSAIGHVCKSTGEELLELTNPCMDKIDLENNKCIENVEQKWNEITTGGDKTFKEEACSTYNDIRPCLETALTSSCKLEITKKSVMGLADSVLKAPCAA